MDTAIIRGTSADAQGNISVEHEPASLGIYTLAVAAKHYGGKVIAQVKQRVESGSVPPRLTVVPGRLVDAIVVDPTQPQMVYWGTIRRLPGRCGHYSIPSRCP